MPSYSTLLVDYKLPKVPQKAVHAHVKRMFIMLDADLSLYISFAP